MAARTDGADGRDAAREGRDGRDAARERLPRTGTRLWSVVGYAAALVLLVGALAGGLGRGDLPGVALALLVAGATTVVYVRPAVELDDEDLHLRRMLSTVSIPLAAVEKSVVTRFLAVFAGERRYVSTTVQRSLRSVVGARPGREVGTGSASRVAGGSVDPVVASEADLVEERIAQAAEDARRRHGVALLSDEQLALAAGVRRAWSWPAVAAVGAPLALLVVALLVV